MLSKFPHDLSGKCFLVRYDTLGFRYNTNSIFITLNLMSLCESREKICWIISQEIHFGEISKKVDKYVKRR